MITLNLRKKSPVIFVLIFFISVAFWVLPTKADSALTAPPFSQDWTDPALITLDDNWSSAPSIIGYRGDGLTSLVGKDPRDILVADSVPVIDVSANETNPNSLTLGGVAEFELVNSTIALQGSGTADAPYIKIFLNTTDTNKIQVSYDVRDIDGSLDSSVQQVALHYRLDATGDFLNLEDGYIADATTGPSQATQITPIHVTLPLAAENQPYVELRIMTANALGNDEWIGIDNISITANHAPTASLISPSAILENQPTGTTVGTLSATDPDLSDTHTFTLVNSCTGGGWDNASFLIAGAALKSAESFDFETKANYWVCLQVKDNFGLTQIEKHAITILDKVDEIPPSLSYANPVHGSVLLSGVSQITVQFSEDVKHDFSAGAANNTENFLLVTAGADNSFQTSSCLGGAAATDSKIVINTAAYQNSFYRSVLTINGGVLLPPGNYRLFVCGATSIEDLSGNKINNGASDTRITFTVSQIADVTSGKNNSELPATGFPMGLKTTLPAQPRQKIYADLPQLWLEIPKLQVSAPIAGVPLTQTGWDVTWLGRNAGWLNQTAFPTWAGNAVLTAHVWDAHNQPGIFYNLKALQYADLINIHAFGQVYTYQVRQTQKIEVNDFSAVLKHEDAAWITLLTCEEYKSEYQTYAARRAVRAILTQVKPEK